MAEQVNGIGLDVDNGLFEVGATLPQAGSWSIGCDVTIEDVDASVQEVRVNDISLSGSLAIPEVSVDIDANNDKVMDLEIGIATSGLSTGITESQIVPYDKIVKITEFSPESINERRFASSALAAKRIYDLIKEGGAGLNEDELKAFLKRYGYVTEEYVNELLKNASNFFYLSEDGQSIGTPYNIFSEKEISANGLSVGSGGSGSGEGGGLIRTVLTSSSLGSVTSNDNFTTFNAFAIDSIYKKVKSIEEGNVSLSNYYTKSESDARFALLSSLTTVEEKIREILSWFTIDENGNLRTEFNLYSTKEISAGGFNGTGGSTGGGLISTVLGIDKFGTVTTNSNTSTFNAYAIDSLHKRIKNLEESEVDLTGYATEEWVMGRGFITASALAPYLKTADFETWKTSSFNPVVSQVNTNKNNIAEILKWFAIDGDGNLYTTYNFYSTKEISSGGFDSGSNGTGGLIGVVYGKSSFGTIAIEANNATFNAYAIDSLYKRIVSLENKEVDLTGYATEAWVAGQGFITSAALSPYMKTADANDTFATKTALNNLSSSYDSLATRVSTAEGNISTNAKGIADNKTAIATNKNNISANATAITNLGKKVTANEGNIAEILKWFAVDSDGNLYTTYNFYSTKEISANGLSVGSGGSGGGLISQVYGTTAFGTIASESNSATFNAYAIDSLYKRIVSLEGKATAVSFVPALTSGKQIGTLSIDGVSTVLYGVDAYSKADADGTFLKLSGGEISGYLSVRHSTSSIALGIKSDATDYAAIRFTGKNGNSAYLVYSGTGDTWEVTNVNWNRTSALLHANNYSQYALPLTGGTISGGGSGILTINRTSGTPLISFQANGTNVGFLGIDTVSRPCFVDPVYYETNYLIHSGNIGSQSVASADKATLADTASTLERYTVIPMTAGTAGKWRQFAKLQASYQYHGKSASFQLSVSSSSGKNGAVCDVYAMMYQQNALGNAPIYTIQTNCDDRKLKIAAVLNYDSSGSTITLYAYCPTTYTGVSMVVPSRNGDVVSIGTELLSELPSGTVITPDKTGTSFAATKLITASGNNYAYHSDASKYTVFGTSGYNCYVDGVTTYFRYGANSTIGMIINSSGNVTIGSSDLASTNYKLYVNGNLGVTGDVYLASASQSWYDSSPLIYFARPQNITGANPKLAIQGKSEGSGYGRMRLAIMQDNSADYTTLPTEVVSILPNGNVGIGTTSPKHKLHVYGNIAADATDATNSAVYASNSNGTVALLAATNRGVYDTNADRWIICSNGTNTWLPAGNVGIGASANEHHKLYVHGSIYADGNIALSSRVLAKAGVFCSYESTCGAYMEAGADGTYAGIYTCNNGAWQSSNIYLHNNGNVTINKHLNVNSSANLKSTLSVTGAVTMSSTLSVANALTVATNVQIPINGDRITFSSATGTYTKGILAMNTSNTYLEAPLATDSASGAKPAILIGWRGCSAATGTTKPYPITITSGGIALNGAVTMSSTLTVDSSLNVGTVINVGSNIMPKTNETSYLGSTSLRFLAVCAKVADFSGNTTIGGTLGVTGAVTMGSTLSVTGATTMNSTLTVNGDVTVASTIKANSVICATTRLRVNATNSTTVFGFIDAALYGTTNNVATVHIGSCYGGASTITNTGEYPNGVSMTAISIYRGVVGIGKKFSDSELRAAYGEGVSLTTSGGLTSTGLITASSGVKVASGQAITFLDASGVEHKLTYDSTAGAFKFDGNILVLGDGQFNAIN